MRRRCSSPSRRQEGRRRRLDDKGWGTFTTFEIEGGLKVERSRRRVEDLVQIDGMNSMGLAGVELHGVIGYNVLARFRIEYDFTADKLAFEPLDGFDPPAPEQIDGQGRATTSRSMGPMIKMLAALTGMQAELRHRAARVRRDRVRGRQGRGGGQEGARRAARPRRPGIKVGDTIEGVKATTIEDGKDLASALAKAGVGTKLTFSVKRGDKTEELTVELGKGL